MHALFALLFLFAIVVMFALGLLSVMRYLTGTSVHDEPAFREPGSISRQRRAAGR